MALLDKISEALGSNSSPGAEQAAIFPEIDLNFVRKESDPKGRGASDGENNFPGSAATQISATEQSIRGTFEQYQQRYINDYERQQRAYKTRVNAIVESWQIDAIENEERALVNDVVAEAEEDADPIFQKRESLRASANELIQYREKHGLTDRLPRVQDEYTVLSIMFGFFLVELAITFFLIRESGGLINVFLSAAVYCALNCAFPFFAGQFVRDVNYKPGLANLWKSLGFIWLAGLIVFGLIANLAMGHYRAVSLEIAEKSGQIDTESITFEEYRGIEQEAGQVSVLAFERLLERRFSIGDTYSYFLFALGLICFFVSLFEGIVKDDPYPKYGEKSKSFEKLYEDFGREKEEVIEKLITSRKRGVNEVSKLKKALVRSIEKVPEIKDRSTALRPNCESAMRVLNTRYAQMIAEYREANTIARSEPAPAYFEIESSLDPREITEPVFSDIPDDDRKPLLAKLDGFSNLLHNEFEKIIAEVETAEDVIERWPLDVVG